MKIVQKFITILTLATLKTKIHIAFLLSLLLLFTLLVWILALMLSKTYPILLGLCFLAYGLGLRHAVDADHIAAIDNTTRKFMQEGKKPVFIGFFFSLGHSTIVILLSLSLAIFSGFITHSLPQFQMLGALIGTAISAVFLLFIGIINLITLLEIIHTFLHVVKTKSTVLIRAHNHLHVAGPLMKLFKPFFAVLTKQWHMYVLGFLFGLGFDTASEVALLSISAASSTSGMPLFILLLLPLSFTAGMALIDSLDGILMLGAYGWAFIKPVRKLYYNLTITLLSVFIAFFIGGLEALQLISSALHLRNPFFGFINSLSLNNLGVSIIGAFILSWIISLSIYKLKKFDLLD